ncbi:MAG: ABC transporter ATP-binding protein [Rudaea sp.]
MSARGLNVDYSTSSGDRSALRDVAFDVNVGEALAIVGESGSGKSTIALSILGLAASNARIVSEKILFEGEDIAHAGEVRRRELRGSRIGTVFQDPFTSLNPALTVGFQVAEPLMQHRRWPREQALARALQLLDEVGISDTGRVGKSYPHQLSGGMQQRALIAIAIACEPSLLLLDEPTTALDVTIEARILDLLRELKQRRGLSIVFITHNLGVVKRFCQQVCVLYAGEIVERGAVEEILATPGHPYTKGLIASSPRIWGDRNSRLQSIGGKIPDRPEAVAGCVFKARCPFAEAACNEPQSLRDDGAGHAIRCWKSAGLAGTGWPAATLQKTAVPRPPSTALIDVRGLRKEFSVGSAFAGFAIKHVPGRLPRLAAAARNIIAVDGVSLSIAPGEVLGVVGESGSGKSTLGRSMLRLVEPSAGQILLRGEDITHRRQKDMKAVRKDLQIILQNPDSSLNPRRTVDDAIGRSITLFEGLRGAQRRARVDALLALVELPAAYGARYPHQLSGGEKQRVGIARALASSPSLIVCDEAVSALDVSLQAAILNLLVDMRDQLGLAYLFISHDLSVVAYLADRIAVMFAGRFVEVGSKQQVLRPPYHPYTRALLAAVPSLAEGPVAHVSGLPDAGVGTDATAMSATRGTGDHELVEVAPGHWIAGGLEAAGLPVAGARPVTTMPCNTNGRGDD